MIESLKLNFPGINRVEWYKLDYDTEEIKFKTDQETTASRSITRLYEPDLFEKVIDDAERLGQEQQDKDRNLIRYLMRHRHTTPFEMVSFIFLVRAPIHVARQWFRHRTWSYNEYSTRYKEAIDSFETTDPDKWRTQAKNNKQGSGEYIPEHGGIGDGFSLTRREEELQEHISVEYRARIEDGVAREQARKDLPLSTYTEFYGKVDLHNLFHFLSLRLDSHAQLEIRTYAQALATIIKPLVPNSYSAFEDYRLNGTHFSRQELEELRQLIGQDKLNCPSFWADEMKPDSLSDREWEEFKQKIGQ